MRLIISPSRAFLRPTHWKAATGVVAVLALLGSSVAYPRMAAILARPQGARYTPEQAARRMLTLCNALTGPCTLEAVPDYLGEHRVSPDPSIQRRHIWQAQAHSDGMDLSLLLNDRTGNLMCVLYGGETRRNSPSPTASIDTSTQAARVSLDQLRRLEMVSKEAEVALETAPVLQYEGKEWMVAWKVRDPSTASVHRVRAALLRRSGQIVEAINEDEWARYARR